MPPSANAETTNDDDTFILPSSLPPSKQPEFVAVILAATPGTRLFPLTCGDEDADDDFDDDGFNDLPEEEDDEDAPNLEEEDDGDNDKTSPQTKDDTKGKKEGGDETTTMNAATDNNDVKKKINQVPKHLLPIGGISTLHRLLDVVSSSGFEHAVLIVSKEDEVTIPSLLASSSSASLSNTKEADVTCLTWDTATAMAKSTTEKKKKTSYSSSSASNTKMSILIKSISSSSCAGSADALRSISHLLPSQSNIVTIPGDFVFLGGQNKGNEEVEDGKDILSSLIDSHRRLMYASSPSLVSSSLDCYSGGGGGNDDEIASSPVPACTMLFSDVGEEDENGVPLKESAKAKKGGIARDEEDIEYIGLSSAPASIHRQHNSHHPSHPQRVMLKQSKVAVEEDEDMTGGTPKLFLPKKRLHIAPETSRITIRTDLNDLHVYVLSPWVLRLLSARKGLVSIQREVIPLLVSRQFRGISSVFGSKISKDHAKKEILDEALSGPPFRASLPDNAAEESGNGPNSGAGGSDESGEEEQPHRNDGEEDDENNNVSMEKHYNRSFAVLAQVLSREGSRLTLRACTVPSYLYGCRELVAHAIQKNQAASSLPKGTTVQAKLNSVFLPDAVIGEKVKIQSSTVGSHSKVGNKCRLNNVVVMENVTVGDNCVLQNSVLGAGATIGENCNLNDCQVAPGATVPSFTKEKGESFLV